MNPMLRLCLATCVAAALSACASQRAAQKPVEARLDVSNDQDSALPSGQGESESDKFRGALGKKLAQSQKFAPQAPTENLDTPESYAQQDWQKHSIDGSDNGPPPFTAFATARNDWFGLTGSG
jgi:hypothetical protein